jgi:hypothetical protein
MSDKEQLNSVWVFNGLDGRFPAAVFRNKERAEAWIQANGVQGILTEYPLDISAYDWCIAKGYFTPQHEDEKQPAFKQRFSSAYQDHYHYEDESDAS